ncbi:hypothetical protein PVAP13_3NG141846 [Panicum virgatum]|uniref:Uncharacterized protein n=1 Tax=Panicum virgatum TaxID=38727 RepID=A0A8T0TW36_PANVG|nr:hypothetical protein PVAP13_3NG141846 [Panicum virgatum]
MDMEMEKKDASSALQRSLSAVTYCCGACGYDLRLRSSDRNTAGIVGGGYGRAARRGVVAFDAIDDARFCCVDEFCCVDVHARRLFVRRIRLLCRNAAPPSASATTTAAAAPTAASPRATTSGSAPSSLWPTPTAATARPPRRPRRRTVPDGFPVLPSVRSPRREDSCLVLLLSSDAFAAVFSLQVAVARGFVRKQLSRLHLKKCTNWWCPFLPPLPIFFVIFYLKEKGFVCRS